MTKKSIYLFTLLLTISLLPAYGQNLKMYVSDAGNFNLPPWQILKFDADGKNGEVFISTHLDWPQDIVFLESDTVVLISNLNSGEILRFHANTGAYINKFATGIGGPTRMKIGADNLLYVLQWEGNGKVWRYNLDGTFVDEFTSTGVPVSIGLDWDTSGNLYVSSYNGFVQRYSPSGADLGKFISSNLAGPTNIWFDSGGDLIVNDYNANTVKRFGSDGIFKSIFIPGVPQCEGVNFLPNGDILMGVGGTSSVRQYNAAGTIVKTLVPTGTLGLLTPNAVVLREESMSTSTNDLNVYHELTMVTPSCGISFQFVDQDANTGKGLVQISNAAGVILREINMTDSITWDASDLPNGIYFLIRSLQDHSFARQKIIVQH